LDGSMPLEAFPMRIRILFAVVLIALAGGTARAQQSAAAPSAAQPFAMNGWQFHEYDVPGVAEAIQHAPQYGVNFFIFSHNLFRHVDPFLASPEHQRDINYLGSLADQEKIPWYLWVHELDDIPAQFLIKTPIDPGDPRLNLSGGMFAKTFGERVNMDDPALMDYLKNRYEKLLDACPNAAGLVLTLHESDYKMFRNTEVQSKLPIPDRLYLVTKLIYDVVKEHHKQLILRNFFYEPKEMEWFAETIRRLPDDIVIMSKDTTHEFDPWYPYDPMHGNVGNKKQIMEIDTGVEKAWGQEGHYAQVDYIRRDILRARETHMVGAVGRMHVFWKHPFTDTHEINLYALSRFLANPDTETNTVFNDWALLHYPKEAAPYVAAALERTESIQNHGRWFLGFWLTKSIGDEWGDYPFYFSHILLRSRYKWTHDPADLTLQDGLYNPDQALFDRLVAEKDEVIAQVRASMADTDLAARYMTPEQAAPLREGFRYLLDAALLEREWTRAFFAQRMWMNHPNEQSAMIVRDALGKLEAMDMDPAISYGRNAETGHRYNIDKFAMEMRWRMANRDRALAEDRMLLAQVLQLEDAEHN
jgi:hypothetical protein